MKKQPPLNDPQRRLKAASDVGIVVDGRRLGYRGGRLMARMVPGAPRGRPKVAQFDRARAEEDALFGDHAARLAAFERSDAS
jgi:hypothetical protein